MKQTFSSINTSSMAVFYFRLSIAAGIVYIGNRNSVVGGRLIMFDIRDERMLPVRKKAR